MATSGSHRIRQAAWRDECGLRFVRPAVRRVVQLKEELVFRKEGVVDLSRVRDVVNGEFVVGGELVEPDLGAIDKGLMDSTLLRDGEDAEQRRFLLCPKERSRQ